MSTGTVYRLTDPSFLDDPGPMLARMRAEGPLVRVRLPIIGRIWATTTDAAARTLLKSPEMFRRDSEPITGKSLASRFWWMPGAMKPLFHTMIAQDDPDHRRLRRLVEIAFARASAEALRPTIEGFAERLLDELPREAPVDIVAGYSRTLPFLTICALLGVPDTMSARLTKRIAPLSHVTNPVRAVYGLLRLRGVMDDFRDVFARARADAPGPGLISALVHAEDAGTRLSEEELLAMVMLLFLAGHETTVHLINNGIVALARDAGLRARFIDQPDSRHLLIEEAMRYFTPAMMSKPMFALEDTDMLGAPLRKGEMVAAFLLAANHDPKRVDDPGAFRPDRLPNAHLGFGFGPHVCLGLQLARIEAVVALERLFARHPHLRLAEPPRWLKRPGLRAPASVRLHLGQTQERDALVP